MTSAQWKDIADRAEKATGADRELEGMTNMITKLKDQHGDGGTVLRLRERIGDLVHIIECCSFCRKRAESLFQDSPLSLEDIPDSKMEDQQP